MLVCRIAVLLIVSIVPFNPFSLANQSGKITVAQSVEGIEGMVVAAHPLAAKVGAEVLRQGGNAVDAAVATAFALGVVEPEASGLGGGGFMLIYLAETGETVGIDYRATAPLFSTPDMFAINGPGLPGYWDGPTTEMEQTVLRKLGGTAVAVPRMLAGMAAALQKYGSMTLAEVLAPAIALAENGFPVSDTLYQHILNNYGPIMADSAMAEVFLNEGLPYEPGETMTMSDLVSTFRVIAAEGPDAFYHGVLAEAIAEGVRRHGGILTKEDLASVQVSFCDPIVGSYRDCDIVTMPPPSSAATIIQILNILEGFDLESLGWNSTEAIHRMAEAYKLAFSHRDTYFSDSAFVDIPLDALLSKKLANELRARIDPAKAAPNPAPACLEGDDTTHLSVVDRSGNMVALTQSLNFFLGAKFIVPGIGVLMNNTMADFDPAPGMVNSIAPGKEPLSSMSPTFLFRAGSPFLAVGSPGAQRILTTIVDLIVNMVDFHLPLQEAMDAPRFHCHTEELFLESRISQEVQRALEEKGYPLRIKGDYDLYFGGAHVIQITETEKTLSYLGVADPRRSGQAAGY
ncbi:gamma-glutamyltransferase [Candidatus Bipolaricaulota bacterium]|nr:gamma-glutamyltransferase [Candidatus Bipolaricaulota bacterium]